MTNMIAFTASLPLSNARSISTIGHTTSATPINRNGMKMVISSNPKRGSKAKITGPVQKPELNEPVSLDNEQPKEEEEETNIPLRITGNNIPLTQSLTLYIEDKLNKVIKRYDNLLTKVDVHLTVEHNPSIHNKNKAEVIAFIGKTILRSEVRSDDMYNAIDSIQQRIARVIRKFKERKESKYHSKTSVSQTSSSMIPDNEDDIMTKEVFNMNDSDAEGLKNPIHPGIPPVNEIVKRKVFPMPLQSVEEAVLCCEYVDHPWYLFRNAETNQICLVYKRNHGGYGLIEPSNPGGKDEEQVM